MHDEIAKLRELRPKIMELINKSECSNTMNPNFDILADIDLYLDGKRGIVNDPNDLIEAAENSIKRGPLPPVGGEDASGWTGADKHNPYRRS